MKILVVDDETVSRKKLQKIMSSFGECEAVESGKAAIKSFEQAWASFTPSFDLITLDVSMPEMDGTEVLKRIRELEIKKEVPLKKRVKIFMVTSNSEKDTVATSVEAGCDDYIVKPFDKEILLAKLKRCGLVSTPS